MRSIAFLNQKGGVGKTTTAVNVAAALARNGRRVLLIDADPQAHATMHLGVELGPADKSIYHVLVNGDPLAEAARFADERVTVIPAHLDLVGAEVELATYEDRELRLQRALAAYHESYDYLILDCAPSLGLLSVNALVAASEVVIPLQPHFFALQGLSKLLETVTLVRAHLNSSLRISGVVVCLCEPATKLAQEVVRDVAGFLASAEPQDAWHGAVVLEAKIRRNIKLAEAPSFGRSIFAYAPASHGADDYLALTREIEAMAPAAARGAEARPAAVAGVIDAPQLSAAPRASGREPDVAVG